MKAVVINQFGPPEVFSIVQKSIPVPKSNQIVVKAFASSVNPIDWKQRRGNHKLFYGSPFPITLGYDVSGIVENVGEKVSKFKPGDRICGVLNNKYGGAYAEYVVGTEKCFAKIPENLSFEVAAVSSLVCLTVLQSLRDRLKLQKGQSILINGAAGGVGHIAIQLAKQLEADITIVSSESHSEFLQNLGFKSFIDYKKTPILELNKKFDIFFDVVGVYSYRKTKKLISSGGAYFTILPRPKLLMHKLFALFNERKKVKAHLMKYNSEDLSYILQLISEGNLQVHIDKTFAIEELDKAHKYAELGKTEGKVCIKIQD